MQRIVSLLIVLGMPLLARGVLKPSRHHPAFEVSPTVTQTADGALGDALNIALIGKEDELVKAMLAAGWFPADAVTLKSSVRISIDTLLHRPYEGAPVSSLYVWARKQDLAFEQPAGADPRKRHHVRFWRSDRIDPDSRPLWLGAATFDASVGFSHRTGRITHHISPDIDTERDKLITDLHNAKVLRTLEWQENFQPHPTGKNGGGDPWKTDQRLPVGRLKAM